MDAVDRTVEGSRGMKEDTIKRSDAVGVVQKRLDSPYMQNAWQQGACLSILRAIEELPSADIPQGEWIRTGRTNIYGGIEVQCSNCGDKVMIQHLEDEWYCRHCGADMGMRGADDVI